MTDDTKTTYLIEFTDGKRKKIKVPSDWKVTFGPVAVRKSTSLHKDYQNKMPLALRFYESETKQRAIFTNVASFRDTSIEVQEERVTTDVKDGIMEVDGSRKVMAVKTEVKEWINPDDENDVNKPAELIHEAEILK